MRNDTLEIEYMQNDINDLKASIAKLSSTVASLEAVNESNEVRISNLENEIGKCFPLFKYI